MVNLNIKTSTMAEKAIAEYLRTKTFTPLLFRLEGEKCKNRTSVLARIFRKPKS